MLGKRLVEYSDDEEETSQNDQETRPEVPKNKERSIISYGRITGNNAIKSLLTATASNRREGEIAQEMADSKKTARRIEFDTVVGKKLLEIDEPREKVWRGKKEREAYYYTAMKEIYKDKIGGVNEEAYQDQYPPSGPEIHIEEIGGRSEKVKSISQNDLIKFDYAKYMEQKERKELLLEEKVKRLKGNTLADNHSKFGIKAYELLEKEAASEAFGTEKEEGIKRNKKQYGF